MIGFRKYSRWLATAAAGGTLLLNAGTAHAVPATACQAALDKAINKYYGAVLTASETCADAVRKAQVSHTPVVAAADTCETALKGVYDVKGALPLLAKPKVSAALAFRAAVDALFTATPPKVATCGADDLVALGHLVSGTTSPSAAAPGNTDQHFLIDFELLQQEQLAIQAATASTSFGSLVNAAQKANDGVTTQTTPPAKALKAPAFNTNCLDDANLGYRPNLCSFSSECSIRSCNLDANSQGILTSAGMADPDPPHTPGGFGIFLSGQQLFNICQIPTAVGYGQGAGQKFNNTEPDKTIWLSGQPSTSILPVAIKDSPTHTLATVCVSQLAAEGYCDCGLTVKPNITMSACQDRFASNAGHEATCGALKAGLCSDMLTKCTAATDCKLDACGQPLSAATNDAQYIGLAKVGRAVMHSGAPASTNGDCVMLDTTQFKVLDSDSLFGGDTIACTIDDTKAPDAPATIPLTTGDASATMHSALMGLAVTATEKCGDDAETPCIQDSNCNVPDTCSGTCSAVASPNTGIAAKECTGSTLVNTYACSKKGAGELTFANCGGGLGDTFCGLTAHGKGKCIPSATCKANGDCLGVNAGHCSMSNDPNALTLAYAPCGTKKSGPLGCTAPGAARTCSATHLEMTSNTVSGHKLTCQDMVLGNLKGFSVAGAFPSGGGTASILGDSITSFTVECSTLDSL